MSAEHFEEQMFSREQVVHFIEDGIAGHVQDLRAGVQDGWIEGRLSALRVCHSWLTRDIEGQRHRPTAYDDYERELMRQEAAQEA